MKGIIAVPFLRINKFLKIRTWLPTWFESSNGPIMGKWQPPFSRQFWARSEKNKSKTIPNSNETAEYNVRKVKYTTASRHFNSTFRWQERMLRENEKQFDPLNLFPFTAIVTTLTKRTLKKLCLVIREKKKEKDPLTRINGRISKTYSQ